MNDPFGDSAAKPKPATPAPHDVLDPKPNMESFLDEPFPKLPNQAPGPAADAELEEQEEDLVVPTIEEALASARVEPGGECPSPRDKEYFTPIGDLSTDTSVKGDEGKPDTERTFPPVCPVSNETFVTTFPRSAPEGQLWGSTTFMWKASGMCHKPLYFEDVHLERYGHSWGPYLQPIISGGHFFLAVPILPYQMGLYPPCECIYTLGYYRPGNCAPYLLDPLPLSIRAAAAQAGASTGMAIVIP